MKKPAVYTAVFVSLYLISLRLTVLRNKKSRYTIGAQDFLFGGAGGIRTRVQTRKAAAFYMLSLLLFFRLKAGNKHPTFSLTTNLGFGGKA
tara:strand:- start:442 stop:714 length:273 start_codon:yes stop_codon:yes gene_type:complete